MLVLTRSSDQEIRIGDDIVIRVLDVRGDRVRIGIDAPSSVSVHRQEVYAEIERANRESLDVAGAGLEGVQGLVNRHKHSDSGSRKEPSTKKSSSRDAVVAAADTEVSHGA